MSAGADDRLGSAAEEATRLIDAMSARARAHLEAEQLGASEQRAHDGARHANGQSPECGWCPLCRAVAFVRNTDPEVRERVVSSATALALSLRELAESAARAPTRPDDAGGAGADQPDQGGSRWE